MVSRYRSRIVAAGGFELVARRPRAVRPPDGAGRAWANLVFVLFAIGAVIAVPEPQAFVILASLAVQAVAGFVTLKRPTFSEPEEVPEAG